MQQCDVSALHERIAWQTLFCPAGDMTDQELHDLWGVPHRDGEPLGPLWRVEVMQEVCDGFTGQVWRSAITSDRPSAFVEVFADVAGELVEASTLELAA